MYDMIIVNLCSWKLVNKVFYKNDHNPCLLDVTLRTAPLMYFYDNSLKNVHTHCALLCDVLKKNLDFNDKNALYDTSLFFKRW